MRVWNEGGCYGIDNERVDLRDFSKGFLMYLVFLEAREYEVEFFCILLNYIC